MTLDAMAEKVFIYGVSLAMVYMGYFVLTKPTPQEPESPSALKSSNPGAKEFVTCVSGKQYLITTGESPSIVPLGYSSCPAK